MKNYINTVWKVLKGSHWTSKLLIVYGIINILLWIFTDIKGSQGVIFLFWGLTSALQEDIIKGYREIVKDYEEIFSIQEKVQTMTKVYPPKK